MIYQPHRISSRRHDGFSLIEIVMIISLLAIMGAMTVSFVSDNTDSNKFLETKKKMEAIRNAILGSNDVDGQGNRISFGYHGDLGRLPGSLTVLTASESPAWSLNTFYGVGGGWRGPYLTKEFTGNDPIENDAWGNAFEYSTSASPPHIISRGADGAVGGTIFDTDITVELPASLRLSTVQGVLSDGGVRLSSEVVEFSYPVSGTLTAFLNTSDANGFFTFSGVPFGRRAVMATGVSPVLGPNIVIVDSPQEAVSGNLMDITRLEEVTYNTSSVVMSTGVGGGLIAIDNTASEKDEVASTTITLSYTVSGSGDNLVLAVVGGAQDSDSPNRTEPSSATFNASAMTSAGGISSGYSSKGDKFFAGNAIFYKPVNNDDTGDIVVTWSATMDERTIHAYTLTNTKDAAPEAVATAESKSSDVTQSITTLTDGAMVVTAGYHHDAGGLSALGSGHTVDTTQSNTNSAGAMGHNLVTTATTITGQGWDASAPHVENVTLAAFVPVGGNFIVTATLSSSYPDAKTLDYITVRWSNSANLLKVQLGATNPQTIANVPSGNRIDIYQTQTIAAGSTDTDLALDFDVTVTGEDFIVTLEWTTGEKDTLTFSLP